MSERWEGYLKAIERWGEPQDVDDAFAAIGRPKEFQERQAEIKAIVESRRRWRWVFSLVKDTAGWIVGVGAAIVVIYSAYTFLVPQPPAQQPPAEEQQP